MLVLHRYRVPGSGGSRTTKLQPVGRFAAAAQQPRAAAASSTSALQVQMAATSSERLYDARSQEPFSRNYLPYG